MGLSNFGSEKCNSSGFFLKARTYKLPPYALLPIRILPISAFYCLSDLVYLKGRKNTEGSQIRIDKNRALAFPFYFFSLFTNI